MRCLRLFWVFALLLSFYLPDAWPQNRPLSRPGIPEAPTGPDTNMQRKLQKQQQTKRYEDMKRDAQRLLELATELKQNVDKSGENILSLDVVRKAEEMEKLARQLKNYMRGE